MTAFAKVTRGLIIFVIYLLLVGCAKDSLDPHIRAHLERPQWITGDDDKYVSSLYLTGRGVSADLNRAKHQSADDLAQSIDRQIIVGLEKTSLEQRDSANNSVTELSRLLDEKTRNFLLQQIRISETWQDPATRAYHVLSTIDRVKVGDEMLAEVYRLDEQVERILRKAKDEKDVLQRVAYANLAMEKLEQRDKLEAVVKIIKSIAIIAKASWDKRRIEQQIAVWLNEVKIMPVAQHKDFNLMSAMKEGVSSAGMTVHLGAKPDYILKGTFEQGQIKWKDGVYSLQGNLKLELLDGEWKGQLRGDANWPIEVSALERDQLQEQLAEAIKKAHQDQLRDTLLAIEE